MQITYYTDYAFRVLIYLALKKQDLATIQEISNYYKISKNHLTRVVCHLGELGFIETIRGKKGGIRLSRSTKSIKLKDVLVQMEPHFNIVECFNTKENKCRLTPTCKLQHVFSKARNNFLSAFETLTLHDIELSI